MTNIELDRCIKEYMNGDESKFNDIYYETKKIVYLSIYSIITDRDTIEDIMQDTYMKAINKLESYRFGTNFKAWISSIARNLSLNEYNRRKKVLYLDDGSNEVLSYSYEGGLIDKCLNLIKDDNDMKQIFIYRIVFELGFREISNLMDIPKSTIHDTYKKIVKILKDNLEDF